MLSTQVFNQVSLTILALVHSLQYNVQEWIRQEIVDDDPYEQEMVFLKNKRVLSFWLCGGG
jgi:hypothetical protein